MGDCESLWVKVDSIEVLNTSSISSMVDSVNCLLRFFEDHFIYCHQWFHIFSDLFVESMLYVMNFISW